MNKLDPKKRHFLQATWCFGKNIFLFSWASQFLFKKAAQAFVPFAFWRRSQPSVTLWGWGFNDYGQVGDTSVVGKSAPVQIGALTTWESVSGGSLHVVATKNDGTLWAWGDNTTGNLGIGTIVGKSSPVQVGALTNWNVASAGGMYTAAEHYNTLAVKTDGTLWTWGDNTCGQLGDGTIINRSSPVQIGGLSDWVTVSAGGSFHSIAIKSDRTLWCWGQNNKGQLGDGTVVNKSSPVQIGALTDWSKISAGESHVIALKTDGTIWTWGDNSAGQLGDNTVVSKSSPIQLGALTGCTQVSAGGNRSYAVKSDGTLWVWGNNTSGSLGIGSTVAKSSPVQVGALTDWTHVEAGHTHTAAIKDDGTLWGWGQNNKGQLGDGTVVNKSSPVQIGAATWRKVSAGESFTVAVK